MLASAASLLALVAKVLTSRISSAVPSIFPSYRSSFSVCFDPSSARLSQPPIRPPVHRSFQIHVAPFVQHQDCCPKLSICDQKSTHMPSKFLKNFTKHDQNCEERERRESPSPSPALAEKEKSLWRRKGEEETVNSPISLSLPIPSSTETGGGGGWRRGDEMLPSSSRGKGGRVKK